MKKAKKSRVSWPSDDMLCQVKMFLTEDCPAKVASQSSRNPKASNLNLPPGFEATQYAMKRPNISHIPRIKWKRPPKYILNDALLVASGEESTETRVENLRISKVFEAFYPHRSVIPTSPSVSQAVEDESYDDNKTPNIRLTPVEDELEAALESSHCNNSEAPAAISGLGPDLSMVVSAALMKAKEHGSLVDADLLVKLLSDPIIIKNLMNEMAGKPLETENSTLNTNITVPRVAPQHVTSSAMDRNSPPNRVTQPGNGVSHTAPVSVQPSVSVATDQPLSKPTQPVSSALSMSLNLQKPPQVCRTYPLTSGIKPLPRLQDSYSTGPLKPSTVDAVVVSQPKTAPKPQSQSLDISTSSTWNTNKVSEPGQTGTNPQISNGAYSMNINRADQVSAKPPVKNLDYFKSLIREHGRVAQATNDSNNYKGRVDNNNNNNNTKVVKAKFQKPCMYFGRARGCKLGESCLYLHDRSKRMWTADVAAEFPRAKRLKFGT